MTSWALVISSVVVVVGWFVNSWNTKRQEAERYRLEQIREYLVDAFLLIQKQAKEQGGNEVGKVDMQFLSDAADKIQLFASDTTIDALLKCVEEMQRTNSLRFELASLQDPLRSDIRKAFRLKPVSNTVIWFPRKLQNKK